MVCFLSTINVDFFLLFTFQYSLMMWSRIKWSTAVPAGIKHHMKHTPKEKCTEERKCLSDMLLTIGWVKVLSRVMMLYSSTWRLLKCEKCSFNAVSGALEACKQSTDIKWLSKCSMANYETFALCCVSGYLVKIPHVQYSALFWFAPTPRGIIWLYSC